MLIYGSLCSGIGSECVAWSSLGWRCKWFSEIDPFCNALLAQRYPDVERYYSVNRIDPRELERVDLIVGGTPCQSFSINRKGKGLDDPRGQLSLRFVQIVKEVRPVWVLWENVPNALHTDLGRAFACITRALAQCGYGWAYRILDLRGFGVPQRRRRLFLVAHLGSIRRAAAVLFDREAEERHGISPPSQWQGSVAGVEVRRKIILPENWVGDTTPKRNKGCIATLRSGQGAEGIGWIEKDVTTTNMRILTINEVEILQGFPPDYTNIVYKRRPATYRQRFRVVGNSFPPPILHWIGKRIDFVNSLPHR